MKHHVSPTLASLFPIVVLTVHATATFLTAQRFEPQSGHPGKDVPWVPTPPALVDKMLDLAQVTPHDYVLDLGSGDGRTVIAAAKRGATAVGIEYDADLVALSQRAAAEQGVSRTATFVQADLFETDFSKATVITMFLLRSINLQLRSTLLDLQPGTRVVSNTFDMGAWQPDETATIPNCIKYCSALLWYVPAKVAGIWRLMPPADLSLMQTYQALSGTFAAGGAGSSIPIVNGTLRGGDITFEAGGVRYTGRVHGRTMEGTFTSGTSERPWRALRTDR